MNPILFHIGYHLAPPLAGAYLRLVEKTSRVEVVNERVIERVRERTGPGIYAIWHSRMLYPAYHFRHRGAQALISRSRDGDIIVRAVEKWGYRAVRGSSSRGGATALRGLVRVLEQGRDVVITPDGPRGPREEVQPGVVALARLTGYPIVPLGYDASRKLVFNSWDRFVVPLPFGRIRIVFGEPIEPSGDEGILRSRITEGLAEATAAARLSPP